MAAVGLAQNFAALRALSTEGIQRGHMSLHARNLAVAAGAPSHSVNECVSYMLKIGRISLSAVTEYLEAHNLRRRLSEISSDQSHDIVPSMFFFENRSDTNAERITLNIAFKTIGTHPVNIFMSPDSPNPNPIIDNLFGSKSYSWVSDVLIMMDKMKLTMTRTGRSNYVLSQKLKILSILINILTRRLFFVDPTGVKSFIEYCIGDCLLPMKEDKVFSTLDTLQTTTLSKCTLFQKSANEALEKIIRNSTKKDILQVGLPLILALWQVFECWVRQSIGSSELVNLLLSEQRSVLVSLISKSTFSSMKGFLSLHTKRLQVTMFLLCDSVQFDQAMFSSDLFSYIKVIGQNLEFFQTASHDLSPSRLMRDIASLASKSLALDADLMGGVNNSFLVWLHLTGSPIERILKEFELFEWDLTYRRNRPKMLDYMNFVLKLMKTHTKPECIDTTGILKASRLYHEYYDVMWIGEHTSFDFSMPPHAEPHVTFPVTLHTK
jgi:hypothetical protein